MKGEAGHRGEIGPAGPPGRGLEVSKQDVATRRLVSSNLSKPHKPLPKISAAQLPAGGTVAFSVFRDEARKVISVDTARCPARTTALYGGAGLIATGAPDSGRLRITYSRPFATQGAPEGWSAGAQRVKREPSIALALWYLARAEYKAYDVNGFPHAGDVTTSLKQSYLQADDVARGMFEQAVAGADDATAPNPHPATLSVWGVQAWVVCGTAG